MSARGIRERVASSRFVRQVGALWTAQGIVAAAVVVQGILVARWLGPRAFGVGALIVAVPSLVFTFMDARASEAAVRYLGEFHERDDAPRARAFCKLGMGLDVTAAAATLLIVAAAAPWASRHVVHDGSTVGLLLLYGCAMVVRAPAATAEAVLVTLTRFKRLAVLQSSMAVARAALVIALVGSGHGIAGLIWGSAAGMAAEGVVMVGAASLASRTAWGGDWWSARVGLLRDRTREIAHFVLWSDAGSLLGVVAKQLDVVLVGAFSGATIAGYYGLARSLGSLGGFVVGPVQSVLYQRFSSCEVRGTAPPSLRPRAAPAVGRRPAGGGGPLALPPGSVGRHAAGRPQLSTRGGPGGGHGAAERDVVPLPVGSAARAHAGRGSALGHDRVGRGRVLAGRVPPADPSLRSHGSRLGALRGIGGGAGHPRLGGVAALRSRRLRDAVPGQGRGPDGRGSHRRDNMSEGARGPRVLAVRGYGGWCA